MPIYEYRCPKCKQEKEIVLPFSQSNLSQMCSCGETMAKMISLPAPTILVVTNRDRLVAGLNNDSGGYKFPGHGDRYKRVIGNSLFY